MDFSQISFEQLPLHSTALLVFYLVVGFYVIFSAVLYYHWDTYATDNRVTGTTLIIYALSTIPLLIIMGLMIFLI